MSPSRQYGLADDNPKLRNQVQKQQEERFQAGDGAKVSASSCTASTESLSEDEEVCSVPTHIDIARAATEDSQVTTCAKKLSSRETETLKSEPASTFVTNAEETRKRETAYLLDISQFKLEIAQLKERIDSYELMEARHGDLQQELAATQAEAETAQMAASYLSDIADQLREIKSDELEKKKLKLQMTAKEQSWISFVQLMLENFRTNTADLSLHFDFKVVKAIETSLKNGATPICSEPRIVESPESYRGEADPDVIQEVHSQSDILRMADEKPRPTVGKQLSILISKPSSKNFSRQLSFRGSASCRGGGPESGSKVASSWKVGVNRFHQEIRRVERMIAAEAESMQSIQIHLKKEHQALEEELGQYEAEAETMFTTTSGEGQSEIVDHLSAILLQRQPLTLPRTVG